MAKPGSNDARQIAGGKDLGELKARLNMTPEEALEATEMIEVMNGLRCGGCGKRLEAGFTFVSISVRDEKPIVRQVACARKDCDWATLCRNGATYVEKVHYVWMDEQGADAPPAKIVVERRAKMDAKVAAAVAAESEQQAD